MTGTRGTRAWNGSGTSCACAVFAMVPGGNRPPGDSGARVCVPGGGLGRVTCLADVWLPGSPSCPSPPPRGLLGAPGALRAEAGASGSREASVGSESGDECGCQCHKRSSWLEIARASGEALWGAGRQLGKQRDATGSSASGGLGADPPPALGRRGGRARLPLSILHPRVPRERHVWDSRGRSRH